MRILVCDHVDAEGLDLLKSNGFQVDDEAGITREKLIQKIPDYEVVIVRGRTKIEAGIVNVARKLKIIGRAGVGLDNIDLKAAEDGDQSPKHPCRANH
jgi:D-3-phosphoglycerate dehydrogenase